MTDGARRSIRDIAHLYISSPRAVRGVTARCIIAGVDRDSFPGFHVANLAAAMRAESMAVRVVERSRLLLNAARFLALPPRVYAGTAPASPVVALDGVEVWFATPPPADGSIRELVHAPPLEDRAAFERCLAETGDADLVVVARREDDVPGDLARRPSTRILLVDSAAGAASTQENGPSVLVTVTRWRRSLPDPLPAAVRDRNSHLSRTYRECARRIAGGADYPRSAHVEHSTDIERRARAR